MPKNQTTPRPSKPYKLPSKDQHAVSPKNVSSQANHIGRVYDLIVVGAGPAGLTAAGRAGSLGAKVLVLEKNREPGKKLTISGGGRCNVTNAESDIHTLVQRYGKEGKRLFSVLSGFMPQDCIEFFQNQRVPIKIEAEKRAFPADNKAQSIRDALVRFCTNQGVEILTQTPVSTLTPLTPLTPFTDQISQLESRDTIPQPEELDSPRWKVATSRGQEFFGRSLLIATGGFARPETGSTGDGFGWLESLGHRVIHPEPILVPIRVSNPDHHKLMGLSSQDWGLSAFLPDGGKAISARGKILFTHFGLSGPLILNHSLKIQELEALWKNHGSQELKTPKGFELYLDFFPDKDPSVLDKQFIELVQSASRKKVETILAELLPSRLAVQVLGYAKVPGDLKGAELSKEQRKILVQYVKAFPRTYGGRLGNEKAIVSRGGVDLNQVNFKTMESQVCPGLYLAGDILDFDRPSGGFSLQICWSTGWRVGEVIGEQLSFQL